MATSKERTPSFIATIRLKTNRRKKSNFWCCLIVEDSLYNACLGECLNRLKAIQNTDLYKETIRLSKTSEAILKNVEQILNI